jgi:hypothetical protein
MGKDLRELDPVLGPEAQTGEDQVLALPGEYAPEAHLSAADLIVFLVWNVAAHLQE